MPEVTSIVFVVDDDVSVRESLELLIKSAGWRLKRFRPGRIEKLLSVADSTRTRGDGARRFGHVE
jgi:FixJ family two-component response regulator